MNEKILKEIENSMTFGEIVIFHKTKEGIICNRHRDLEQFCLEILEGLKLQQKFHQKEGNK